MEKRKKGLTLLEVVVAVAAIALIAAIGTPIYQSLQTRNELDLAAEVVKRSMRRAQGLSQMHPDVRWGVSWRDGEVVVFRGSNFENRDQGYDEGIGVSKAVVFTGVSEIVFSHEGTPSFIGDINISIASGESRTLLINSAGLITLVVNTGEDEENPPGEPQSPEDQGATVAFDVNITSDWSEAYCANVNITTESEEPVMWEVEIVLDTFPLNGTPYNVWNAQWSFENEVLQATGDGWNSLVSSSTPRNFGFCATR